MKLINVIRSKVDIATMTLNCNDYIEDNSLLKLP